MTGITLSEAMEAHGESPSPAASHWPPKASFARLDPANAARGDFVALRALGQTRRTRAASARGHHYRSRCLSGKSRMGWSSASGKNIPLRDYPKSALQIRHPVPLEGRIAIVTDVGCGMRWTRQRRARDVFAGRLRPVSDRTARRRPALKRLRQNLGRDMSRSKRFGGGSRGRQRRVVLAPVAGVKLMEICRAQPGVGGSSIRQRWRQEEFVSRESAL